MNTLTDRPSTTGRSPSPPPRVPLLDRLAMRLGLALLMWGRRRRRRTMDAAAVAELRRLREHYEHQAAHAAWWQITRIR
ncbi:hypothetical protein [Microbacterium sp. SORGH_AS_0888]|uniref:hypothetical protein n=1 Tax=Microbacterium sp. SORGH_AS_0888 TaxID=3041791 RepID=UPI002781593F|nr:hypothetical protein [Microbacterium sp. SORGH_AS_0888]MDQ1128819.1 hypothetical protein [Microbacterium sp. SORGH_AS_0888]